MGGIRWNTSKPAVVFIHGFACSAVAFEKQFSDAKMLQNLHLVRYEVRGHCRSGMPEDPKAYESARHAEDFRTVCEAFNLKRPFVAGWSFGGLIPCDVAAAYGADYMSGIIYMGATPSRAVHSELVSEYIMTLAGSLVSTDLAVFSKATVEFAESCVADQAVLPFSTKLAWIGGVTLQSPTARKNTLMKTQDDRRLLVEGKDLPVLVLQGSKDLHLMAEKTVTRIKELFSNAETHLFEGVGHCVFYERPEETNTIILNFVNRAVS